jgi:hypothetical protein
VDRLIDRGVTVTNSMRTQISKLVADTKGVSDMAVNQEIIDLALSLIEKCGGFDEARSVITQIGRLYKTAEKFANAQALVDRLRSAGIKP